MLKHTLYITLIINCFLNTKAQTNLVPNPNFVLNDTCPDNWGQLSRAKYWTCPTPGTSDYYNQCCPYGNQYLGVPYNNTAGFQEAINNDGAYAGLIAIEPGSINYREYIQAKLTSTLTVNQKYFVTIYVSLLNNTQYATDALGIYLSKTAISKDSFYVLSVIPQVENPIGHFLKDTLNWMKISGSFIADSAYQYITIGNFKDDAHTDTISVNCSTPSFVDAYYYIDDICVSTDSLTCNTNITGINTISNNRALFYYDTYNKKIVVKENSAYTLQVIDAYGNKVNELKLQGYQNMDVSTLPTGCYIMLLSNQQGNFCKKFMVSP